MNAHKLLENHGIDPGDPWLGRLLEGIRGLSVAATPAEHLRRAVRMIECAEREIRDAWLVSDGSQNEYYANSIQGLLFALDELEEIR